MNMSPSKSNKDLSGVLYIKDLVIPIHIGVTDGERKVPQDISIDLELHFLEIPKGCTTDRIEDTFCYEKLCGELNTLLKSKEFNLVERLTLDIFTFIEKKQVFSDINISIKKRPKIDGLNGHISMELSRV